MRVLIVEDDAQIARSIRAALEEDGHLATICTTGRGGVDAYDDWAPDAVLVDLVLPDIDGREVVRRIRSRSSVPILIVTAKGGESEVIAGLEAGADDYVVKPFRVGELLARVRAVVRRSDRADVGPPARRTWRDLTLDPRHHRLERDGREVRLSKKEFEVMRMLIEAQGGMVSRDALARAIWGLSSAQASKTLDVHVSAVRRKIGDDPRIPTYIETIWGVGFRLIPPED